MKKYKGGLTPEYQARCALLAGNDDQALEQFRSYLKTGDMKGEAIAKEYLEYAKVLLKTGQTEKALHYAQICLKCPREFGNSYYFEELSEILD